jgi:hypothetical protein
MNGKDLRIERLFINNKNTVISSIGWCMFDCPLPGMNDLSKTTLRYVHLRLNFTHDLWVKAHSLCF